jgi:hypothetical protein
LARGTGAGRIRRTLKVAGTSRTTMIWDNDGRLTSVRLAGGKVSTYTY